MNYGYGNAVRYVPLQVPSAGYATEPPRTGGMSLFGADPAPGALDKLKAFMDQETAGVKNKYLLAGAAALGVGYYGYTKGWF